ncbi:MAG: hypothetical protein ACOX6T_06725 [Myxococcales bacterium]
MHLRTAKRSLLAAFGALAASLAAAPSRAETVVYLEAGPEYLDGQAFAALEPGVSFESRLLEGRLGLPVRLRLNAQLASRDGVLRREDWDDLSDAGRVVRRVELSLAERTFTLRLGALAHEAAGHGTIVNGLGSSLDPDSLPLGAKARLVLGPLALELLGADMFAPGVVGGAATVEPLSLWGDQNDRLHVSAAFFADPSAPARGDSARALVYGLGIDFAVLRSRQARLAPYFDANGRGTGFGLHAGLLADVALGTAALSLKAEWRRAKSPYLPEYFDIAYPIERHLYFAGGALEPKADAALGTSSSWRGEARLAVGPLSVAASLSGRGRSRYDAALVANLGAGPLDLAAFAALRGFEWGHAPEKLYLLAEGRYRLGSYLYLWASGGRLYRIDEERRDGRSSVQVATGLGVAVAP